MFLEYQLIIVVSISFLLIATVVFLSLVKKKKLKEKIELLSEEISDLHEKLRSAKIKVVELETKSNKTSYVADQIQKIATLNDEVSRQKNRVQEAKAIAQEASMVKYDFLTNVSHEIRTPMNSILVFAELLSSEIKDKKLLTYSNNIFQSGHKLLSLLDDVVELSKIESGGFELETRAVDMRLLLENIIQEQKNLAIKKGLKLTLEIDETLPISLIVDAQKIKDILYNLVENALKFTQTGYVKLKVKVKRVDIQNNKIDIVLTVEDSGIGIEKSNQEKIFKIFEKREESTELELQGTGLGLSINQKMARLMNGELSVESRVNVGSCFSFVLYDLEIVLVGAEDEIDEQSIDFSLISPDGASIMVIDENIESQETIKGSFLNTAVKVYGYHYPRDAIERLRSEKIDLIFIDIDIFSIDENAVAKVIAKMSEATVVTLTQTTLKNIVFEEGGAKVVGHLKKPISKVELFKISMKELNSAHIVKTRTDKTILVDDEFVGLDKKEVKEFLMIHTKDIIKLYKKAIATNDLNTIKLFSQELLRLATLKNIKPLEFFAKELLEHIEHFEIDEINSMMSEYKNKIKSLQNL